MVRRVWYVDAARVPINWDTAFVTDVAVTDIFAVRELEDTPGNTITSLWWRAGVTVGAWQRGQARAAASTDPVPGSNPYTPPAGIDWNADPGNPADLAEFVSTARAQDFTDAEELRGRSNIGAASIADLDGRLASIPGVSLTATAATTLSGHRAVRDDGTGAVVLASNTVLADAVVELYLTLGAADAGAPVSLLPSGRVDEPSWNWTRGPVWLGADGLLTQTPPASPAATFIRQIGTATSPTALFLNPQPAFVLA